MTDRQALRQVVVDTKEANNHDLWFEDGALGKSMPGTFAFEGMQARKEAKEFGDVWIDLSGGGTRGLVVELKSWEDLHASVRDSGSGRADSRIRHQLAGLLALQAQGHPVAIMAVGVVTPAGGKGAHGKGVYVQNKGRRNRKPWSFFELEQIRFQIQRLGIPMYQAPSEMEVPHALRLMAEACEREVAFPQPGLPRVAALSPRLSFLATVMTAVPGISTVTGLAISNRYKTFTRFMAEGSVEDLIQIDGIGKLTAQKIRAAWHGMQEDPEVKLEDIAW